MRCAFVGEDYDDAPILSDLTWPVQICARTLSDVFSLSVN